MTDSNDWRVTISLADQAQVGRAQRSLPGHEVEEDVRRQLGRNIAVSAGDSQIFLYAGTEMAAREAERVALDVLGQDGIQAEAAVHHWHPIEEEWEDPGVAMPGTEAERQAEHQRLEDSETAESLATGAARRSSWSGCRTSAPAGSPSCPADRPSASPWPGRSPTIPKCCCSTSRSPRST